MNETRLPLSRVLALLLALLLSACAQDAGAPPLAGASIGGPFTLTSHEGRRVSDTDFAGQHRLVYFGFTYCPDVCPVDLQTISAGLRAFEEQSPDRAAKVAPLFISVDPARDTVPVMREYVSAFHPRLVGLTGSEAEVAEVAKRYGVFYSKGAQSGDQYLVNHSRIALLFGPDGKPIAIVPHDQGPSGVTAELDRWVR